jgi:hypothetical protein
MLNMPQSLTYDGTGDDFSCIYSAEIHRNFSGISSKNDFPNFFCGKFNFFHNICERKFSTENSAELSPEKMYKKLAFGVDSSVQKTVITAKIPPNFRPL